MNSVATSCTAASRRPTSSSVANANVACPNTNTAPPSAPSTRPAAGAIGAAPAGAPDQPCHPPSTGPPSQWLSQAAGESPLSDTPNRLLRRQVRLSQTRLCCCSWRCCATPGPRGRPGSGLRTWAACSGWTAHPRSRRCAASSPSWPAAAAARSCRWALARAHAAARPDALGFLQVDGHVRVYAGTRDLPKTHIARMHLAGHATAETWVADADADTVLVVTAPPAASLASELVRLLPELRALVGPDRRATVVFDRGGWSPTTFAAIRAAGFDLLTYRKGPFDRLPDTAFTAHTYTDPDGQVHGYRLAETTVELPLSNRTGGSVALRQVHRQADDGTQIPVLTSRTDLPAAEVCWRLAGRWRQENYFKYARAHFALDALDSYADTPDDPTRPVPNPAKAAAKTAVESARVGVRDAEARLSAAIDDATSRARRPGSGATATVDPAAFAGLGTGRVGSSG